MTHNNEFTLETTTIWNFPNRGNWGKHTPYYRGNWSPYVPRNIILRYSKPKDIVLDQFLGGGTTLLEASKLNRKFIGVDINPNSIQLCQSLYNKNTTKNVKIKLGSAENLSFIEDSSIDLIACHPPYANAIKYSSDLKGDISLLDIDDFLSSMTNVARESFRVLKSGHYCAFLIGDVRKRGNVYPLGFKVLEEYLKEGFTLKEIVIKEQHNCKMTEKWKEISKQKNFLLLAHEYLFILYK